ncbi:MAG: hypothetical protein EXS63_05045 [Candidatus Omnitrophica bacterium]|nr:hypothetical protein [Candidatus Omnitrophota bacterium]
MNRKQLLRGLLLLVPLGSLSAPKIYADAVVSESIPNSAQIGQSLVRSLETAEKISSLNVETLKKLDQFAAQINQIRIMYRRRHRNNQP